jgi:hypothetical protein
MPDGWLFLLDIEIIGRFVAPAWKVNDYHDHVTVIGEQTQ